MSELDRLLSELKTEYEQSETPKSQPKVTPLPQDKSSFQTPTDSPLDNLLADVKTEFEHPQNQLREQSQLESFSRYPKQSQSSPKVEDNWVKELKAEYQEKQQVEEQRKQEDLAEAQRLQEQRRQRRRQALTHQAQEWLKKLNPKSEEGIWFEEFSYSYNSKLEAAIDYLEALRESHS